MINIKYKKEKSIGLADHGLVHEAQSMLQQHISIRANLPKLLARAIRAGHQGAAVAALLAWGEGTKPLLVLWQEVSSLVENSSSQEVKKD
ncbi:MAG: hypothetical protein IMW96_05775 [Thermoanaerobacteraceae bacterium]|nr:hypothetical protein [Thermoanaerobacteraceae bacterium]